MNMYDIIEKKRDGGVLSDDEIKFFVNGYTDGSIPDYQAAAFLMAAYIRDLDREEIYSLTRAMKFSGDIVDLSEVKGIKVDKHSTGGVGDKTTMVVGPLTAACGVPVAKMSGRGLGFTGGTIDKLESIRGFRTSLEPDEFINQVNRIGLAVAGQTAHVAPADKKIYALRDVTATVDSLGLITSSIMSKKLASGSNAIVLDVKCGSGAFMQTPEEARALGELMCRIGRDDGVPTVAVITDMSQPLGRAVGNSLEVTEAIETLKGRGPEDIQELSLVLSGIMIHMGGMASDAASGYEMARDALLSGAGLEKFTEFVRAQGGDPGIADDYSLLPQAAHSIEIKAENTGFVTGIDARKTGLASQHSGAGRATKEDSIDLAAGIYLQKKTGDAVRSGETLAVIYANDEIKLSDAATEAAKAFEISENQTEAPALIKEIIGVQEN